MVQGGNEVVDLGCSGSVARHGQVDVPEILETAAESAHDHVIKRRIGVELEDLACYLAARLVESSRLTLIRWRSKTFSVPSYRNVTVNRRRSGGLLTCNNTGVIPTMSGKVVDGALFIVYGDRGRPILNLDRGGESGDVVCGVRNRSHSFSKNRDKVELEDSFSQVKCRERV